MNYSSAKKRPGMTLMELMIALGLIGVIAALAMPMLINNSQSKTLSARQQNASEILHNTLSMTSAEMGLFPMEFGPDEVFTKDRLKASSIKRVAMADVPAECQGQMNNKPVVGDNNIAIKMVEDITAYGFDTRWKREGFNGKTGDWVCLYNKNGSKMEFFEREREFVVAATANSGNTLGSTSTAVNSTNVSVPGNTSTAPSVTIQTQTSTVTVITRDPDGPVDGSQINGALSAISSGTITGTTSGGQVVFPNIARGTAIQFTASKTGYLPAAPKNITVVGNATVIFDLDKGITVPVYVSNAYRGRLGGASISGSRTATANGNGEAFLATIARGTVLSLTASKAGYDPQSQSVVVNNANPIVFTLDATPLYVIIFSQNNQGQLGSTLGQILNTFSQQYWNCIAQINSFTAAMASTWNQIVYYAARGNWGAVFNLQNQYNHFAAQVQSYQQGAQWNLNYFNYLSSSLNNLFGGNSGNAAAQYVVANNTPMFFDRSGNVVSYSVNSFAQSNGLYIAPDGTRYRVVGNFGTPVKISLKGEKAKLDSNDDYLFDYDGFARPKLPIIKPAGGLNPDEAWLVLDRHNNGIVDSQGIIDGDDVFGDHVHKVANGYLDMGQVFQKSLKRDKEGKLYFDVKPLPWWEQLWVMIARFFGYMKDPIAGMDLKLLDRQKHIVPAHTLLQKVYVDYWTVDEWDKTDSNWIGQRAKVQFVDGHWSESADQWFKIGYRLTPIPPGKQPATVPAKKAG